jgi:hypothetical protein
MTNETVQQIIDRAAADPDFRTALANDPLGAAADAGFNISADDVRAFLGRPDASDAEIVEELRSRMSHTGLGAKTP